MDPSKRYNLADAITVVGTCEDMCPEYERHEREYANDLMDFEKVRSGREGRREIPGTNRVDHQCAVKKYSRSAADSGTPLPCDLRPPMVLKRTLTYLLHTIIPTYGLEASHAFVRDRLRAIRKDLTIQNIRGLDAIDICEPIARFHILCAHRLCESTKVDVAQEVEQMRKCVHF
ncbi:SAC3/GANP/Nin1/mts3/eIF-3 p25 family-domain-containing protein [Blyttiomyces helicus]|uniref:SAC3/GANP/Nin1/mts3/eIF-3 p25 family-domain-containing protein n=1 Tax=Blyttiomyces helicus TaxID=388810 RepID=A0A4P9W5X8_9FUNG|nr:SAC3/GANP/Nin1/mts3/eIF-3 p25 family-domain-containing protein [Blyttiomyces helicus]|eukprot:RKO86318.1 SAC3/GANP/Nin1/mts3/eIF-3 p25 family-domain-containing protein [Blyttiomyces helicus]